MSSHLSTTCRNKFLSKHYKCSCGSITLKFGFIQSKIDYVKKSGKEVISNFTLDKVPYVGPAGGKGTTDATSASKGENIKGLVENVSEESGDTVEDYFVVYAYGCYRQNSLARP
mgnify:CR=1 FL=1